MGIAGNTGTKTDGPHLHFDLSSEKGSPWLTYLSRLNGLAYNNGTYQSTTDTKPFFWYNPKIIYGTPYEWINDFADIYG